MTEAGPDSAYAVAKVLLAEGRSDAEVLTALAARGWSPRDADVALRAAQASRSKDPLSWLDGVSGSQGAAVGDAAPVELQGSIETPRAAGAGVWGIRSAAITAAVVTLVRWAHWHQHSSIRQDLGKVFLAPVMVVWVLGLVATFVSLAQFHESVRADGAPRRWPRWTALLLSGLAAGSEWLAGPTERAAPIWLAWLIPVWWQVLSAWWSRGRRDAVAVPREP